MCVTEVHWTFSELKKYIFAPKSERGTLLQKLYSKCFICKCVVTQSLDFLPHFCTPSFQSVLNSSHIWLLILRLRSMAATSVTSLLFPLLSKTKPKSASPLYFDFGSITLPVCLFVMLLRLCHQYLSHIE